MAIKTYRPLAETPRADWTAEQMRTAMRREMVVWQIPRHVIRGRAKVMPRALGAFLDGDDAFQPTPAWLDAVRAAFVRAVQERARTFLAAWDPDDYGAWQRQAAAARQRALDEMQARLAAAGRVA